MVAAAPGAPLAPDPALRELFAQDPALPELFECDRALVAIGRHIKVLKAIEWPVELEEAFLSAWRRGQPTLPAPPTKPRALAEQLSALEALMQRIDRGHPIGNWLYKSAWSYSVAARMLASIGTPEFTRCSALLYGRPDFKYRSQDVTNFDSAREMLDITDEVVDHRQLPPVPFDIPAEAFAVLLRERIGPMFTQDKVDVVLDPALSSKAAASAKQITLRSTALFSESASRLVVEVAPVDVDRFGEVMAEPIFDLGHVTDDEHLWFVGVEPIHVDELVGAFDRVGMSA